MDSFKNYLIDEYKDKAKGFVAVDFKFVHSVNIKLDKKSNIPIRNDIMKVNMTFYDKDMNKLFNSIISFENDILPKASSKKLINIAPKELENRYTAAKKSICDIIFDELNTKKEEIENKINELNKYIGEEGIVPSQFKGELINPIERAFSPEALRAEEEKPKSKSRYEM